MAAASHSLDALRREIDTIDDQMHDLLMRREQVVGSIGTVKTRAGGAGGAIRPGREAEILRRLIRRHRGRFPASAVVRMWREMVAAFIQMQGPFSVAVAATDGSVDTWDLARDYYGSCTEMTPYPTARRVLDAVGGGEATIGVLSLPRDGEPEPWWHHLLEFGNAMPRVIARLPFIAPDSARHDPPGALAVARLRHVATGQDVSLFAVETGADVGRPRLEEWFATVGLPARNVATRREAGSARLHLVEVADFVAENEPRLVALRQGMGGVAGRVVGLGGYAVPVDATETRPGG